MHSIVILKKKNLTKFQSSFDVPAYQVEFQPAEASSTVQIQTIYILKLSGPNHFVN